MAEQVQPLCRVPVGVVPNPIAVHAGGRAAARRRSGATVLMVINGWGPRKNGDAGLRAHALLCQSLPEAELHLFGAGTEEGGPAWRCWHGLGAPGKVSFNGAVPHAAVLEAMSGSDLMLHPALEESFGAVLAEAMSAGLPVVAGRDSGAVAWVVGDAGVLVDVTRPQAMADAMRALLTDPAALAVLAQRGREGVAARFSPRAVVSQYEREYEAVLRRLAPDGGVPA
jgi:glycosyltransferase involved in cell wall biosynthesis